MSWEKALTEMPKLGKKLGDVKEALSEVIKHVEPNDKEAQEQTPFRWLFAMDTMLRGYYERPEELCKEFDITESNDLVVVKDIPVYSLCKHHILPFFGWASVGYLPDKKVIGLSKIARIVESFSKRLQLQEQLGRQVADTLMNSPIKPKGVIVVIDAEHMCMQMRGPKAHGASTITSSLAGAFVENSDLKREFYQLIK